MTSPLPPALHAQAVRLRERGESVTVIASKLGRPLHQIKHALGWQPWSRRKGTS